MPFPAINKLLIYLEFGKASDDEKIGARNSALFGYYSQLFNSDDGEKKFEFVLQRAKERVALKIENEAVENQTVEIAKLPSSHSSGRLSRRFSHRVKAEDGIEAMILNILNLCVRREKSRVCKLMIVT